MKKYKKYNKYKKNVNIFLWRTHEQEQQEQRQNSDRYSTAVLKIKRTLEFETDEFTKLSC